MTNELSDISSPAVAALSRDTPIVLPIAAMEQHGRHLPLFTDSFLVGEIARRAGAELGSGVQFAPVMWLGNSHHHLDFPGTITAAPRVYLDMLGTMVECFLWHGFRRIVLLNGHGGNTAPGQQALFELREQHRKRKDLLLLLANYWTLAGDVRPAIPGLTQPQIQHACQWETAMMLRLRPDLVGDFRAAEPVDFGNPFQPAMRASIFQDFTQAGHVGDPASATAEIGEALLAAYAAGVASLLRRVIAWDGQSWSG